MSAGFLRRFASIVVDAVILLSVITATFNIFGGTLIRNSIDDFDVLYPGFLEAQSERLADINSLQEQRSTGLINDETYTLRLSEIDQFYNENYAAETTAFAQYLLNSFIYFIVLLIVFNYVYQGTLKGLTLGRRLFKLKIQGRVTWWTLFLREVLWKYFYWLFTLGFGFFLDFILVTLTQSKKTVRDYLTQTRIILEDTLYPF